MLYNHIDPAVVGNDMRILVTEMAGRASVELKGRELGLDLAGHPDACRPGGRARSRSWRPRAGRSRPPTPRSSCWCARELGGDGDARRSRSSRTGCIVEHREDGAGGQRGDRQGAASTASGSIATAEGNGPVNALDEALRGGAATPSTRGWPTSSWPTTRCGSWTGAHGTDAVTRVLVETDATARREWTTVGVHDNVVEASWQALVDALAYAAVRRRTPATTAP